MTSKMRPLAFALIAYLAATLGPARAAEVQIGKNLNIPYKKFVLTNGLTLIVHEDHKAPIVAVNIWYHVGSKNEKRGKTGFAHLFEHLMFQGSEHFNDDYFKATEKVGTTDQNGTTSEDRTNYFEDAPKEALDYLLWLESDRMGHLLGVISQARLDEQRGVVQNEKRQNENQPYGKVHELIKKGTYPFEHPYSWTVIGSMEDLNAASLDDVREWFRSYYGPNNATLVVAGDVDTEQVHQKVIRYFGDISASPPMTRYQTWTAKMHGTHREITQDRVPLARVYEVWNIPPFGSAGAEEMNLVSDVLGYGKNSRLYKRLVYDEQIATDVSCFVDLNEIGGQFYIVATARPGEDLAGIEKIIDEERQRLLDDGPTEEEMQRVKTANLAQFIRGVERIGGFGGKSDILAEYQVFTGSPDNYKVTLDRVRNATADQLRQAARDWLQDGVFLLEVHPYPDYETVKSDVDRSKLPVPEIKPESKFPDLAWTNLSNGLRLVLAERHAVPILRLSLLIDAGYAADQFASPGTAKLAMNMLDEGTEKLSSLQISEKLALAGASLNAGSDLDMSVVTLSALKEKLDPALDLFADVVLHPAFPEADFKRLQRQQLDAIQQEKVQPMTMALRVFPRLLYGPHHAYGNPFTGSGTMDSVSKLTPEDMRKFHDTWFKADNATLVIVGDTTMDEMVPKLENLFKDWKKGPVPQKDISPVEPPNHPQVYLIDRPGSIQSIIFAGRVAPPKSNPHEIAIETMNDILGGSFTSRINMNLREDKHWSYGSHSFLVGARGQRPFLVFAPVQTDKTSESMHEVEQELSGIIGSHPITEPELEKAKKNETLQLPGAWETIAEVASSIAEIVRYRLPEDYFQVYPDKISALDLPDVEQAAKEVIHPNQLTWVVVGDRSKIESGLRDLGLGELHLIDTEGKPIQ